MSDNRDKYLVSTDWLADHMDAPDILVIDGSWHLPPTGRDGRAEYNEAHIPGAIFFDIDDISDDASDLPHMLPRPEKFASRMRALGIGDGQKIIVYDQAGLFSAPRVWWMFHAMGHQDVAILDGGLPKWMAEDRPVTDELPKVRHSHFSARRNAGMVVDADEVAARPDHVQLLDARPANRFAGEADEPRPGLRKGHVPGACNLPFGNLLNEDKTLKGNDELKRAFADAGLDLSRPVMTMCGSGVTAAILSLALEITGNKPAGLYDGSWAEWGGDASRDIQTGA
ncbi:3-mercaptopyruvate sulfurtransferase [Tepidamorphus sp. 3E244]|uniref:3-mercaptopyruvate sulfurtransferase n=1 Tax=Tepidamorphus sp. 3E244 TaxID=3385498 RepID=UPI0038FCDEC7